jgi:energy-coupling factor transport system substrate-specific component
MTTFDQIAGDLQARRAAAGAPSYAEIALRIAKIRELRGGPDAQSRPARTTVYDAFREGRRRMDTALVLDIVRALGATEAEVEQWAELRRTAHAGAAPAPVREPAHEPETPPAPPEPPPAPPAPPTVNAALLLCLGCLAINLFGRLTVNVLEIPLYLDMVGTAVAAIILGPWWGAGVGVSTNFLGVGLSGYDSIPFAVVNVAGALVWGYGVRRFKMGSTIPRFFGLSALSALCCTLLAVPIILALGGQTGNGADDVRLIIQDVVNSLWLAVASSNIITSLADKTISGAVALLAVDVLPWTLVASMRPLMPLAGSRPEPPVRSSA